MATAVEGLDSAVVARSLSGVISVERILAPTDFSECSAAAIEYALYLAARLNAELHVMHVVAGDESEAYWFSAGDSEAAEPFRYTDGGRQLMDLVTRHTNGLATTLRGRLQFGEAPSTIIRAAGDRYDLIVMGTHGRRGISHIVAGSVAEAVVRHAACPALLVCSKHLRSRSR